MSWRQIDLEAVLRRLPLGVAVCDARGLVVYANPHLRRMLGLRGGDWRARPLVALRVPAGEPSDAAIRRELMLRGRWHGETVFLAAGGGKVPTRESAYLWPDPALPEAPVQIHFFEDLALPRRLRELAALALHDALTGLPNRRLLADRLDQAIARSRRSARPFGLVYLDVDHFKAINDCGGHAVGDEVLREIAQRLRRALRRSDTVARLGGDEFAVLIEDIHEPQAALKVIGKLLAACCFHAAQDTSGPVSVSAGVSFFPRHGVEADVLLRKADEALYRAKAEGRGRCVVAQDFAQAYRVTRVPHRAHVRTPAVPSFAATVL